MSRLLIIEGQEPDCRCDEAYLIREDGKRGRRLPGQHNCAYILARNALIPLAESQADVNAPSETVTTKTGQPLAIRRGPKWILAFFKAMDVLALEKIHRAATT